MTAVDWVCDRMEEYVGLFHRRQMTQMQFQPVAGVSHNAPPLVMLFAALGWWLDGEGVRDFTMLDTPTGGVFIKGVRPRMNYRSTATEIVSEHFDAARLDRLISEYQKALSRGTHAQRRETRLSVSR
jgi:hypothetical protein